MGTAARLEELYAEVFINEGWLVVKRGIFRTGPQPGIDEMVEVKLWMGMTDCGRALAPSRESLAACSSRDRCS